MPVPYNTDDLTEERLAGYFEEIYGFLSDNNVPDDRLPSPWHILSHLITHVDYESLRTWLDDYVEREGEPSEDEDEDFDDEKETPRNVRPLRALSRNTVDDSPDGEQEEEDGS